MKNIKNKIEAINNSVSQIDKEEYKHIFSNVLSVLNDMSDLLDELNIRQESLEESIQYMDKDITGIQDELFEEVTIEDLIEMDDEFTEVNCKNCNKQLFVEKEAVKNNKAIPCPFCHNNAI